MLSSWLHPLKGWSLRETRGGSFPCQDPQRRMAAFVAQPAGTGPTPKRQQALMWDAFPPRAQETRHALSGSAGHGAHGRHDPVALGAALAQQRRLHPGPHTLEQSLTDQSNLATK
ncbi:hypothetical protein E0E53_17815 [Azotobacter chroococcum]|nr:hypothetical protein E0E53_17815 [Azotobacter chroococcum]